MPEVWAMSRAARADRLAMVPLDRRLKQVGTRRVSAEHKRIMAARDLHETVREAAEAGWTKTRIAKVAGISRQTVHEILRD